MNSRKIHALFMDNSRLIHESKINQKNIEVLISCETTFLPNIGAMIIKGSNDNLKDAANFSWLHAAMNHSANSQLLFC